MGWRPVLSWRSDEAAAPTATSCSTASAMELIHGVVAGARVERGEMEDMDTEVTSMSRPGRARVMEGSPINEKLRLATPLVLLFFVFLKTSPSVA